MDSKRFLVETRPAAVAENIVCEGSCRFTVLTSRLIRCEYAAAGVFEDRASQRVFFRDFPKTDFAVSRADGILTVETEHLKLTYRQGETFSAQSLQIALKGEPATVWHYGETVENLGGTCQTLDGVNGATALEDGVCSRYGYALLSDSDSLLLNEEGWVEVRSENTTDLYFFGYGYCYLEAVKDLYRLTGAPPMLPAYALGNWWSRYYDYTQQEYLELMDRFRDEDIPFSVSVVDMDWHITKVPPEEQLSADQDAFADEERNETWTGRRIIGGWTGYTWNKDYFPDYKAFLKELKKRNLKTSLNLHPHAGVLPHEVQYPRMAQAMGIDPASRKRVPFDILSPEFMANYFDILHHPYEQDGVDFWWMDWQQGENYWWIHAPNKDGRMCDPREALNPLWMLNHLHIADISKNGKRPMFFSRYSGVGAHRYPVGFSGDTMVTWDSLDFQPYFTATASNVGYSWWSHDIGGHFGGYRDAELELRWMQLGVFSPINRLHSCNNDMIRKEPWTFPAETQRLMSQWLRLRHQLFPYLYTMNYRNHKDLEPLVQPMYYRYPKCESAYTAKNQYLFGSELMVTPITAPGSEISGLASTKVFFPQGSWFDFFNGSHYFGDKNRELIVCRDQAHYPVFAKAGAIVPLKQHTAHDNRLTGAEQMELVVFPGKSNSFTLYEDAGEHFEFEKGGYCLTRMHLSYEEEAAGKAVFTMEAPSGDLSLLPAQRQWKLCFRGFSQACALKVWIGNSPAAVTPVYCRDTASWQVTVQVNTEETVRVELEADCLITDNGDRKERCYDILRKSKIIHDRLTLLQETVKDVNDYPEARRRMGFAVGAPQEQPLIDALLEQISLIKQK